MKKNSVEPSSTWIDPDDAPEITEEWAASADLFDGEKLVRRGRPRKANPKSQVTLRLDREVLGYFRETGEGWQTLMNDILRAHVAIAEVKVTSSLSSSSRLKRDHELRAIEADMVELREKLQKLTARLHKDEESKRRQRA